MCLRFTLSFSFKANYLDLSSKELGDNEPVKDWKLSVEWLERAKSAFATSCKSEESSGWEWWDELKSRFIEQEEQIWSTGMSPYEVTALLASMYRTGGFGLEADLAYSGE